MVAGCESDNEILNSLMTLIFCIRMEWNVLVV